MEYLHSKVWLCTLVDSAMGSCIIPADRDTYNSSISMTFRSISKLLEYVRHQLEAITLMKSSVKISFDIKMTANDCLLDGELCQSLDQLLAGDRCSSLQRVCLHKTIPFSLFPKLSKAGLLAVLRHTWWKEYVQATIRAVEV